MSGNDEDWEDDLLGSKREAGITREAAKKLLDINPSLRAKGVDTNFILNQAAQTKGTPLTKAPSSAGEPGLDAAQDVDHLLELTAQQYAQEKRELESELSILQGKLNGLKARYCRSMMSKLGELDRNLTSPLTQAALQTHRQLLNDLGFTPHKLMEHLRSRR